MKSHKGPEFGIYIFRSIDLIWSIVVTLGDKPPWTQKIEPYIIAAIGK